MKQDELYRQRRRGFNILKIKEMVISNMNIELDLTESHIAKGIPRRIVRDQQLSCGAKGLYTILFTFSRKDNIHRMMFPSLSTLSLLAGLCRNTLSKILKELESFGYIKQSNFRIRNKTHKMYYIPPICKKGENQKDSKYHKIFEDAVEKTKEYYGI